MPQIDPSQVSGWCSRVVVKLDPSEKGIYVKKKKSLRHKLIFFLINCTCVFIFPI